MFLKLEEFGGISFRPEESVSLSIVHVGLYLVALLCRLFDYLNIRECCYFSSFAQLFSLAQETRVMSREYPYCLDLNYVRQFYTRGKNVRG